MTKPGDENLQSPQTARSRRADATRAQILEIAKRHFARSGYRGATTAAIAAEAGISDPGLLHHFHSKRGLLQAILDERYGEDEPNLASDVGDEPLAHLRAIVKENQSNRLDVLLYSVLLAESLDEQQVGHDWFTRRFQRVRDGIAMSVHRAQARGTLRDDLPAEDIAAVLVAAMDGLQYQWLLAPSVDMWAAFRTLVAAFEVPGGPAPSAGRSAP